MKSLLPCSARFGFGGHGDDDSLVGVKIPWLVPKGGGGNGFIPMAACLFLLTVDDDVQCITSSGPCEEREERSVARIAEVVDHVSIDPLAQRRRYEQEEMPF